MCQVTTVAKDSIVAAAPEFTLLFYAIYSTKLHTNSIGDKLRAVRTASTVPKVIRPASYFPLGPDRHT